MVRLNFDTATSSLRRGGNTIPSGGRASALLRALVEANGSTVPKADLIDASWPGMVVEDGNLTVQIAALRKTLGTKADGTEWIVTVPRVGYRLVRSDVPASLPKGIPKPGLAVLPFVNISDDSDQDYFADGIVEDIITALSRFKQFTVVARSSSFVNTGADVDVREATTSLGIRYLLEGSIRKSGRRLRLSAQLIDAVSGVHLWANNFDGTIDDVFDMQDRITGAVVAIVEPTIQKAEIERMRRERPDSSTAYDLYLRSMAKLATLNAADSAAGVSLMEEAIKLDPEYLQAVAMAAWAYEYRIHMGMPELGPDDRGRCLELARRVLASSPEEASIIARCGLILQLCAHEWEQGLHTIERAVALNPNHVACQFFGGVGHIKGGSLERARAYFERAIELSPHDENSLAGLGHIDLYQGHHEEALERGQRALAANPNFGWIHWVVICSECYLGHKERAAAALATYRSMFPDVTLRRIRIGQAMKDPLRASVLFNALEMTGLPED